MEAGEASPLLPDDVIYSILLHLPFKSLLRLRRVSNRWNQIITSRAFSSDLPRNNSVSIIVRSLHPSLNLNKDRRHFFSLHTLCPRTGAYQKSRSILLPYMTNEIAQRISISLSGVDGLLYILGKRANGVTDITLWNPCTNRSKMLSLPARYASVNFIGFGYDSSVNDYKIIVVCGCVKHVVTGVRITSLNSDCSVWRRAAADVPNVSVKPYVSFSFFDPTRIVTGCQFAAVGEDMHWLCVNDGSIGLLSFNTREEKLSFTMPSFLKKLSRPHYMNRDSVKLCVYKECLYLCCLTLSNRSTDELRVLKWRGGDGSSEENWEVEKVIEIKVCGVYDREVIGFTSEGILMVDYGDFLFAFEVWLDSKRTVICSGTDDHWHHYQSRHILEMGSLVSP